MTERTDPVMTERTDPVPAPPEGRRRAARHVAIVAAVFALLGGNGLASLVRGLLRGVIHLELGLLFLLVALGLLARDRCARWIAIVCVVWLAVGLARGEFAIDWAGWSLGPEQARAAYLAVVAGCLGGCAWCLRVLTRRDVSELFRSS